MDNGERRLLAKPARDPAEIEHEVAQLRHDCAVLLQELEGRYQRVLRVPRRLTASTRRFEQRLQSEVAARPVTLVGGALLLGASVAILRWAVRARERQLYLLNAARARRRARTLLGRYEPPAWVWLLPERGLQGVIEERRWL